MHYTALHPLFRRGGADSCRQALEPIRSGSLRPAHGFAAILASSVPHFLVLCRLGNLGSALKRRVSLVFAGLHARGPYPADGRTTMRH